MASTLRIAGLQCHAVGLEGRNWKSELQLRSSVSFRGREIGWNGRNGVTMVTGKRNGGDARAALMQAAPLPMRSHETRRRY